MAFSTSKALTVAKYHLDSCLHHHAMHLSSLPRYLTTIPNEVINMYEKGEKDPHPVVKPLARSVEIVEAALEVNNLPNNTSIVNYDLIVI